MFTVHPITLSWLCFHAPPGRLQGGRQRDIGPMIRGLSMIPGARIRCQAQSPLYAGLGNSSMSGYHNTRTSHTHTAPGVGVLGVGISCPHSEMLTPWPGMAITSQPRWGVAWRPAFGIIVADCLQSRNRR